jgi:hypothetical protein
MSASSAIAFAFFFAFGRSFDRYRPGLGEARARR